MLFYRLYLVLYYVEGLFEAALKGLISCRVLLDKSSVLLLVVVGGSLLVKSDPVNFWGKITCLGPPVNH